jgi:hypothetical protein
MDTFFRHQDAWIALVFTAVGFTVVGSIYVYYWFTLRREEIRAGLKQTMLERGMSAYEIRTVIEAGSDEVPDAAKDLATGRPAKPGR